MSEGWRTDHNSRSFRFYFVVGKTVMQGFHITASALCCSNSTDAHTTHAFRSATELIKGLLAFASVLRNLHVFSTTARPITILLNQSTEFILKWALCFSKERRLCEYYTQWSTDVCNIVFSVYFIPIQPHNSTTYWFLFYFRNFFQFLYCSKNKYVIHNIIEQLTAIWKTNGVVSTKNNSRILLLSIG